jgi:hypothetical protein
MKIFVLKLLATAVVAWAVALALIALVLYFSNDGADFSLTDIVGFGGIVIIGSGLLMLAYYLPALLWLRRRTQNPWSFPVVNGLLLNIPIFTVFLLLAGRKMALSEASLFAFSFLAIGIVFGAGFALTYPTARPSSRNC